MANQILRDIAASLHAAVFYTVMVDKTTDVTNKEQVVIVVQWVDDAFNAREDFIGLYVTGSTNAQALVAIIKNTLLRLNLNLGNCCGQCYNGASTMSGLRNGVAKLILGEEPKTLYSHCYGHALNLAVWDCVKQCSLMRSTFDVFAEISKLVKKSPKRDAIFEKTKI